MADLQFYRQRVQAQVGAAPDASGLRNMGQPLAQAVSDLGQSVQRVQEYNRVQKMSMVSAAALGELEGFQFELETDQDYDTHYQRYEQRLSEVEEAAKAEFGKDTRAFDMWRREFSGPAIAKGYEIQRGALKGQIGKSRANLDQSLTTFAELAVSGNPDQDEFAKTQGLLALDDAVAAGIITPEDEFKRRQGFLREIVTASIQRDMLNDPEGTESRLLAGEYEDLQGAGRIKMIEIASNRASAAVTRRLTEETRAREAAERADKEIQKTLAKDGDALLLTGALTADWIEAHADDLSASDYRYFTKALRGGGEVTDVEQYADLRERAGRGENIIDEARDLLTQGGLKRADYDRLIGVVENTTVAGTPWFKRGEEYISRAMKPNGQNYDPVVALRQAEAMDQWKDWADRNPAATGKEAQDEYKRIVTDISMTNGRKLLDEMQARKYIVGPHDAPDWDATEESLFRAYESKQITEEEFVRRASILDQIRSVMQAAQPTEGAP